jgi:hypothetical protein
MQKRRAIRVAILLALLFPAGISAIAQAGESRDNPNYAVWAKFKPGSTSTVTADIRDGENNIHVEVTRTLESVSDDKIVVKKVSVSKEKGHVQTTAPETETIPAKTEKDEIKETGKKDIDAMGKTFKCRVWDSKTAGKAAAGTPSNPAPAPTVNATVYVSDDVPGGVVRLDMVTPKGQSVNFVLTSFEAK